MSRAIPKTFPPFAGVKARRAFFAQVSLVESIAPCWIWCGTANPSNGYATFKFAGRTFVGYRFAYEAIIGPVPQGAYVLHACDDKRCVNPRHLRLGTRADNTRDVWVGRRALAALADAHAEAA